MDKLRFSFTWKLGGICTKVTYMYWVMWLHQCKTKPQEDEENTFDCITSRTYRVPDPKAIDKYSLNGSKYKQLGMHIILLSKSNILIIPLEFC